MRTHRTALATGIVATLVTGLVVAGGGTATATTTAATTATGTSVTGIASGPSATQTPPPTIQLGHETLHRCTLGVGRPTWCGHLRVPINPADAHSPRISIGFGWLPASQPTAASRPAADGSTVVAEEGGPGYPATGTAPDFGAMLGRVLRHHNLLLVDARGTGRSAAIDCKPLQTQGIRVASRRFLRATRSCAHQLNHTYRRYGGGFVHASNLFGTAYVVHDLAAVITSLGLGKVDLYGDSYGTYVAQSFISYDRDLLHAVVLDSAYEAKGLDPWYRTTVTTARAAFAALCRRSLACSTRGTGRSVWQEIGVLAAHLRSRPVEGWATGYYGHREHYKVGVLALLNLVNDAGYDYEPYRFLYAAARAYLERGDTRPLLRLYAHDVTWDYSDYKAPPTYYSDGAFMAVACTDYPQLYSMHARQPRRHQQLRQAIQGLPARTFAPFTTREWIRVLPYTETYTGCLVWPKTPRNTLPVTVKGKPFTAGHVPVLVLNGDLDSLTPAAGGKHVARQLGPSARSIVVKNMVHLVGLDDRYGCGASLVRRFLARPAGLDHLDASCGEQIPEIHALGDFPLKARATARSLAKTALATAGDAANRWYYSAGKRDRGLRGGTISYRQLPNGRVVGLLHHVKWVTNAWTSGRITFTRFGLAAHTRLTIHGPRGSAQTTHVRAHWRTTGPHAMASVVIDGRHLTLPAP